MQKFGALTLICLVILDDKLRREAAASVSGLRDAGIHVVMITGDNRETAAYIASRCGILGDGLTSALTDASLPECRT